MTTQYFCQNEQRKQQIITQDPILFNGIDYLEVGDLPLNGSVAPQRQLQLHFLLSHRLEELSADNIRIEGGETIRNIGVSDVQLSGDVLLIEVDKYGDFSTYTLRIVQGPGDDRPPSWVDPMLASVSFSFKVACPSDLDCKQELECPPESLPEPEIDYLAKDYASFRELMLDRLSTVTPEWQERNPADIGIAAVETLAYAADQLSYYQDAVATETYLGTARKRVSMRRHARLLDYPMHDGVNARVWVVMQVSDNADEHFLHAHTPLITGGPLPESAQVETITTASTFIPLPADEEPEPELALDQFTLFALESLCIKDSSDVHSGHVGTNQAIASDLLDSDCDAGWSVVIGTKSKFNSQDSNLYGNRVMIKKGAKVIDVFYNEIDNKGTIGGDETSPLSLPLLSNLPAVPTFTPGTEDILVVAWDCMALEPGSYRLLTLENNAVVVFCRAGIYNFQSWSIGDNAKVLFSDSVEIRIDDRLETGMNVQIRPNEDVVGLELAPHEIVIYVAGVNTYVNSEVVPVVVFGEDTRVVASLYAPNGLVHFTASTHGIGCFFGRQLIAGPNADMRLTFSPEDELETRRTCITGLNEDIQVFETMHDLTLYEDYNEIRFYTWGDERCCLPKGATRASLDNQNNELAHLKPGDVLLFEEVLGLNGVEVDADISHRHAVRLTHVEFVTDPLYEGELPYITGCTRQTAMRVANIEWAQEDALPFPLCLWQVEVEQEIDGVTQTVLKPVGVARGNVVLADHGRSICDEPLLPEEVPASGRYRPRLRRTDVTFSVPYSDDEARSLPAADVSDQEPRAALPAVELEADNEIWLARRDLINSDRFAPEFVVETEDDGRAYIRFGDNVLGKRPAPGANFTADYRIGNGTLGNVGAESINQVVLPESEIEIQNAIEPRNPLPAQGGIDPESIEEVRLYAPQAIRTQRRAVTAEDYATVTEEHPEVQRAVATRRWTGSWHTIFIAVDRFGGLPIDAEFETRLRDYLEPFRVMSQDIEIEAPRLVALDIALIVSVDPFYLRSSVQQELLEIFSDEMLADGSLGFFHPDNLTFGEPVYLSEIIATAMEVVGVVSVDTERFQRLGQPAQGEIENGVIPIGRLEIARLDNDPSAPQNGQIEFIMQGGL